MDDGQITDPALLGEWCLAHCFSFLDAKSLAQSMAVAKHWRPVAEVDSLWKRHWEELKEGKYLSSNLEHVAARSSLAAYRTALQDARRTHMTAEELCEIQWSMRFLPTAGPWFIAHDPYYNNKPAMQRTFQLDGSAHWHGMVPDFFDDDTREWQFRWQFVPQPPATRARRSAGGAPAQRVRLRAVGVHPWPAMVVERTADWAWTMENAWVHYTVTARRSASDAAAAAAAEQVKRARALGGAAETPLEEEDAWGDEDMLDVDSD